MMNSDQVLDDLGLRLANLAADASDQIRYLQSLGPISVDELALELEEALAVTWIPIQAGVVTEEQLESARSVDALLDAFSGPENADKWTPEALVTANEWKQVRIAAKEALRQL